MPSVWWGNTGSMAKLAASAGLASVFESLHTADFSRRYFQEGRSCLLSKLSKLNISEDRVFQKVLSALNYHSEKYRCLLIDSICQRYGSRRAAGAAAQEQTQPLSFNQAFVNLVIRQSKASPLKERTDKPQEDVAGAPEPEGCADTALKVSDLFCSVGRSGMTKVIFLFGKPGTGKTMLMHRICQKWAEGVLPQFLFAFLFEFRQLNLLKRKLTLKELLFDLFLQPEDSPDAVFQCLLENARHTLIIFDGLDEFAANMDVSSSSKEGPALTSRMSISKLFAGLCHGKLLPGCTVLVTSRPKRLPDFLLNTVDLLAEIWGFDHEKVEEYVSRYFRQHSFKEQAIAHLKNNTKLLSMCLIPALCYVVCTCLEYLLLKHQVSVELPQTMTQFYIKMLLIFINKQQGEHAGGEETQLNCNRKAILGLCDLALKGLEDKKLVFYLGDTPEHVKEFASLHGLLTVFEVKTSGTCPEAGYAFVHLSLQEFFAALCLMVSKKVDKNYLKKKFSLKSKWILKNEAKTEFMESFHIFLSGFFLMIHPNSKLQTQGSAWNPLLSKSRLGRCPRMDGLFPCIRRMEQGILGCSSSAYTRSGLCLVSFMVHRMLAL
uniref:NACHT domain-containing protein n=1 Tax=Athene cunicularia TaxID=194338 RepID=A0A663MSH6_ATHCN